MDMSFSKSSTVMGAPIIPCSRGLVLSCKSPYQPISSKINAIDRKHRLAVWNKLHVTLRPKLIETVKHKLIHSAKILPLGREERMFSKNFNTTACEKLLHASRCSIYTTAGAITGVLFVSTERVGFCSDKSLKTFSAEGEVLKFQYKVSIPLGKVKGVAERVDVKRPSNKYVEFVTVDDFSFWFLGFSNHKKILRSLIEATTKWKLCHQ